MDFITGLLATVSLVLFGLYRYQARKASKLEKDLMIELDERDFLIGQEKLRQLNLKLDDVEKKHEEASKRYRSAVDTDSGTSWRPGEPGDPTE